MFWKLSFFTLSFKLKRGDPFIGLMLADGFFIPGDILVLGDWFFLGVFSWFLGDVFGLFGEDVFGLFGDDVFGLFGELTFSTVLRTVLLGPFLEEELGVPDVWDLGDEALLFLPFIGGVCGGEPTNAKPRRSLGVGERGKVEAFDIGVDGDWDAMSPMPQHKSMNLA